MPRNTSGVYTLPSGNPVIPGTVIDAAWANSTLEDMATEITNSLSRTGAGGMLAPFRLFDGSVTAPGLSFLNETNTGLYRSGSGSAWMSVLGVNVAQFSTVGLTIPFGKALTAGGNASVAGTLAVTGATAIASTLAVTGAITAIGGVVGNVTGNVTAASGTSTFNNITISGTLDMDAGSSATIINLPNPTNSGDAANKGYVDAQVATRLALTGGTMTGAIAMSNNKVTGLATPTADQDAATKAYVDSIAQGLDAKASCLAATTANITLSGTQTIDGVAVTAGARVLVKNQSSAAQNGIYVAAAGSWSRAPDADTWDELVAAYTFIEQGTDNGNNGYICTISAGGTLGTTPVTWAQFSGAGQVIAGAGLTKTGNTLAVGTASSSRIVVGADDIDLATTGVTASTYKSVTVDAYGRVTGGSNPTTLAGYGITDAYTTSQVDTLVNAKLSLTGGTMSGAIAMGGYKVTGLADPTSAQDAATKNYIDTIFGSTTTAAASAAAAAASATSASNSATSASNSATAAAGSATSAANSYTTFNNQYLGSKSSDPSVNNTGGALVAGNLYWNSTVSEMRVYNGSAWTAAYLPASGYLALTGGTLTGNLGFNGTGLRITGDLSNNTVADRLSFQSSTTNGQTYISALTNGTATTAGFAAYASPDGLNTSVLTMRVNTSVGDVRINSDKTGTGTYLPLTVYAGGSERGRVTTTGNWLIGTTTDDATNKLQVTGGTALTGALSVSGAVTLSGGTANGVPYLNGSKVLTSGSALTFDGTTLTQTVADAATSTRWSAATGKVRLRPYADATNGAIFEATNAAESAYVPLSMFGSVVYVGADTAIVGKIGGSEQTRLTSTGLGIGTSSPSTKLDVNGAAKIRAGNALYFQNAAADANATISAVGATGSSDLAINAGGGNVGIGTTTPGRKLEVYGSGPAIKLNNGTYSWTVGTGAFIDGTDSLVFYSQTIGGEVGRFNASGNFLVGTSSASGSASNTAVTISGAFQTASGSVSAPSSTATAVATLPNVNFGTWIVNIALSTGVAATWSSSYILNTQGTSSNIGTLLAGSGSGLGISMSGLSLRVQQGSGATQTVYWSITRIF